MSLKLAAGLSIVCGGSLPASAERAIVVELSEPAPFAANELADAMRMRLPAEGAPVRGFFGDEIEWRGNRFRVLPSGKLAAPDEA